MEASASSSSNDTTGASIISLTLMPLPPPSRLKTLPFGETCSYVAVDTHGCRMPRSCQSCLEMSGCMINTIGRCVSRRDEAYEPSKEHQNAIDTKLVVTDAQQAQLARMRWSQEWQFPAGLARYCIANDAACSVCTRANFWRPTTSAPDSRFCLGDDGACVCVDVCERRAYVQPRCVGGATRTPSESSHHVESPHAIPNSIFYALVCMVFLSVFAVVFWIRRRCAAERAIVRQQAEAIHMRRQARSRELGVNPLSLTGWETHRRDLIDKEIAKLASAEEENRRGESEGTVSSDERESGGQSPSAVDGVISAAPYVRLDESATAREVPVDSTVAASAVHSSRNGATITPQVLAPLPSERQENA